MLNDKPDGVSSQDELASIRHCLMANTYNHLDSIPFVLRLIQEMLTESHPSGCPDPNTLATVARLLREEKFKERREKQNHTPLSRDIQTLIDRLKKLKIQALMARTDEITSSSWTSQSWDFHDATTPLPVFSILYLLLYFFLLVTLHFMDISASAMIIVMVTYFISSFGLAILIKSSDLLGTILTTLLTTCLYYLFSINFQHIINVNQFIII
jgi:hypothetical protein